MRGRDDDVGGFVVAILAIIQFALVLLLLFALLLFSATALHCFLQLLLGQHLVLLLLGHYLDLLYLLDSVFLVVLRFEDCLPLVRHHGCVLRVSLIFHRFRGFAHQILTLCV